MKGFPLGVKGFPFGVDGFPLGVDGFPPGENGFPLGKNGLPLAGNDLVCVRNRFRRCVEMFLSCAFINPQLSAGVRVDTPHRRSTRSQT